MDLSQNVNAVREKIAAAALAAGRKPEEITLCAATKVQTDETIRAAIEAVPSGQIEAGYCVGMNYVQIMARIVLPQAMRTAFPPLSNSLIGLVKDTSLARIIAAYELTFAGYSFMKSNGLTWPLFYTGVFYLLFVGILTLLFNYIERRLDYFR